MSIYVLQAGKNGEGKALRVYPCFGVLADSGFLRQG